MVAMPVVLIILFTSFSNQQVFLFKFLKFGYSKAMYISFFWFLVLVFIPEGWAEESVLIRVAVDDRQAQRLTSPTIQIAKKRISLSDNGKQQDDVPNDLIFVGSVLSPKFLNVVIPVFDKSKVCTFL